APAMVSILADGLAILTLLVARIPIIQKLAILCSFWIISIFISVVTLHPIILSFTPPPAEEHVSGRSPLERFMGWIMVTAILWLVWVYGYPPGWALIRPLAFTGGGLGRHPPRSPLPASPAGGLPTARGPARVGALCPPVEPAR